MDFTPNVGLRLRKCHPDNPHLRLWFDPTYHDMRVQTSRGPLIENYLHTLRRVMNQARRANSRTFAIRIDLRFPAAMPVSSLHASNAAMNKYFTRLCWELDLIKLKYPHDMRYVWVREQKNSDKPHYHVLLLFNGNALRSLGTLSAYAEEGDMEAYAGDNLYHRLVRAWEGVVGWPAEQMKGLVEVTEDTITEEIVTYHFYRDDQATFEKLFYAASYMCKAHTKPIAQGMHCCDGSRR
ncbi:inovirus Gp2 family protein [Halomonas sp. TRM85114]|uniref:YagK/YfjJ domain-containing protein n=1 Tax=Halomonas jincaotanensis TaxID=2810616 RepID=UPI001BD66840|nr:inovirus-type Gp2 protein [Halomonas jincaotanensis]MBS9403710.1 inovirus Gp2 family protein [Halomonas jincaotanensis]